MSAPTPPPMTQDESSSETFLGPTGSETEEFYVYQRAHPGLEKGQYLEWFQKRFHKEIELRRRRSDQPSDLEFMVIKKRSKYRERIGEESGELVSYSDQNPHKTYRELADWFQKRFNKEIDITAISRMVKKARDVDEKDPLITSGAIKRSRESDGGPGGGGGDPHPDQTPPMAKRGRRSLPGQTISSINGPSPLSNGAHHMPSHQHQQQHAGTGSFVVELSGRNTNPNGQTPNNLTPNHTPKNRSANLAAPEDHIRHSPSRDPRELPPPTAHAQMQNGHPNSPRRPMWASVNANGQVFHPPTQERRRSRSPPRHEQAAHPPPPPPPPPPMLHSQPPLSAPRDLTVKPSRQPPLPSQLAPAPLPRSSYPHPAPNHPPNNPTRLPPVTGPPTANGPPPAPLLRHTPPRPDSYVLLQTIHENAARNQQDLMRASKDCMAILSERDAIQRDADQKIAELQKENKALHARMEEYTAWNADLQRGNIELQANLQSAGKEIQHLRKDGEYFYTRNNQLESLLKEKDEMLARADLELRRSGLPSTKAGHNDRKARMDMEEWVTHYFASDSAHLQKTDELVSVLEKASMRDIEAKISQLSTHLKEVARDKNVLRSEWNNISKGAYRRRSMTPSDTTIPTEEEHDMQGGDVADQLTVRTTRKGSKASPLRALSASASASATRSNTPSTASTSPMHTGAPEPQPKQESPPTEDRMDED